MPKFQTRPRIVEAEQFIQSGDPEKYPAGVRWGGDLPAGTGCYVVTTAHGQVTKLADGDYVVPEPDNRGHYPVKPDIFRARHQPLDDAGEPIEWPVQPEN